MKETVFPSNFLVKASISQRLYGPPKSFNCLDKIKSGQKVRSKGILGINLLVRSDLKCSATQFCQEKSWYVNWKSFRNTSLSIEKFCFKYLFIAYFFGPIHIFQYLDQGCTTQISWDFAHTQGPKWKLKGRICQENKLIAQHFGLSFRCCCACLV